MAIRQISRCLQSREQRPCSMTIIMKVPVILLNYNSSADCRKCVTYLKRQEGTELEIILVDNCSREEDAEAVRQLAEEEGCTFIPAQENRGYNAGNNIGLRYAAKKGYKYALIANPDMEFPQKDYVARLVSVMEEKPKVAACGSNILGVNNERQSPNKFTKWWMEIPLIDAICIKAGFYKRYLPPQSGYCDIINGCCLLVKLESIQKMGFLDENVFLFCEEAILGKRIQQQGERTYYYHDTFAKHCHLESQKGSFLKRLKIFQKSRLYYLNTYSGFNRWQLFIIHTTKPIHFWTKILFLNLKGIK